MPVKKEKKNKVLFGLNKNSEENFDQVDETEALEKATDSVVSDLPERKRKKYERINWGDRPEHLRKSLGEMSKEEKAEYYRWKAGEEIGEVEKQKPAFDESEIYVLGTVFLPMLCARMPNPLPPTSDELTGFAKVMTPLANKYASTFQYKEELNGALFAIGFLLPRIKKSEIQLSAEYTG